MASRDDLPYLDCEITEDNLREGVEKVVKVLRPDWNLDEIRIEAKSTGYVNKNYAVLRSDGSDGLFLRLVNYKIPDMLQDIIQIMLYLKRRKIGAQILLTFINGVVMEFLQGEVITWENVSSKFKEKEIWLGTAREMARYHSTTDLDDVRELGIRESLAVCKRFIEVQKASAEATKLDLRDLGFPSLDECYNLKMQLFELLKDAGADYAFSHMDSNPTNCIVTKDGVVFVDYDVCIMEYCCVEMAALFITTFNIQKPNFDEWPTPQQEEMFIREYLQARAEMEPSRGPITERDVKFWQFLIRKGKLIALINLLCFVLTTGDLGLKAIDTSLAYMLWEKYQENEKDFHEKFDFLDQV